MSDHPDHLVAEVGQKAIIVHDGKVLLVQYPRDNAWDLPGGRIHKGEEPHEGLKREIQEELGLDIHIGAPFKTFVEHDPKPKWPRYFVIFAATLKDPSQTIVCPPDEIKDAQWFTPDEVVTKLNMWPGWGEMVRSYFP